ncbi:unnamed protein product [Caenorhabditis sp. 36 PRJEB53466]|nr:unnamed protein product [Caenorhabditis sp. 36 PRJEB53466]
MARKTTSVECSGTDGSATNRTVSETETSPMEYQTIQSPRWTASTSHVDEHEDAPGETTTMLGFASFLIAVKSVTFIIYLVLLIVSEILLDRSFFFTILAFGVAEFALIGITIYHGIRPTLKVVFVMLGFEMTLTLVKMVFAIVLMAYDGGKDCYKDDPCSILRISVQERFYLFFFIMFTAFADSLIALLTISNSPQMHEFEMGDDYLF